MSQLVKTKRQANFKGFKRFGAFIKNVLKSAFGAFIFDYKKTSSVTYK
jgi:hypothetical protein